MRWLSDIWNRIFPGKRSAVAEAPSWANFFSADEYNRFIDLIERYFREKKLRYRLGDGVVFLEQTQRGDNHQLGLFNLAQLCARHSADDWNGIITDHFQTMEKSQREQHVLEERLTDFERVEELLSIRLWPEDYLGQIDSEKIIHRVDLPGTISALVFDLPSSIRNVTPEEAETWGKSHEELFAIALEQVRENCIPDKSDQQLSPQVAVRLLSDESFFVASHALLLDDYHSECVGGFGSLVGIPHRHVLLAYPIEDLNVVPAINLLIPILVGMEREGPGSISPRLYWYRHGEFTDLPYSIKDRSLNFFPPTEFVELLNLLGEGEIGGEEEDEELAE